MTKKTVVRAEGRIVGSVSPKATFRTTVLDGRIVKKRMIDPAKDDFTAQFTWGFRNSVRRAREENRALEQGG